MWLTSGINKIFWPRELLLTRYDVLFGPFSMMVKKFLVYWLFLKQPASLSGTNNCATFKVT